MTGRSIVLFGEAERVVLEGMKPVEYAKLTRQDSVAWSMWPPSIEAALILEA